MVDKKISQLEDAVVAANEDVLVGTQASTSTTKKFTIGAIATFVIGAIAAAATIATLTTSTIKPDSDAVNALKITKADGTTSVMSIDTTNGRVGIGTTSPNNLIQVLNLIDFNNIDFNTKIGYTAGGNIVDGAQYNTFIGYEAGLSSLASSTNVADNNIGIGYRPLYLNRSGKNNVSIGYEASRNNTTGESNISIGYQALRGNATGINAVAIGHLALTNNIGNNNIAVGFQALINNSTGYGNVSIGSYSGAFIANGSTANQTSNTSVYLGYNSKALADGDTNEIVIGYNAIGSGSNTATIGNTSITSTLLNGNVGIGTTSPTQKLEINGGMRLNTATAKPTCDAGIRGTLWYVQGGAGVADTVEACIKNAGDSYLWQTLY